LAKAKSAAMLGAVLLEPSVAQFASNKAVLDDVKDELDTAESLRLEPLNPLSQVFHLTYRQGGL